MARIGVYNHIFQPLFLEKPTDEQLELAIYGLKRVKELEQQNSNQKIKIVRRKNYLLTIFCLCNSIDFPQLANNMCITFAKEWKIFI